jgi:hypothetical protein
VAIKYLENYCKKFGSGLDRKYLSTLRNCLAVKSIEERRLSDGFSYFPVGSGVFGRILKIVDWGRLFLEFNIDLVVYASGVKEEDLVWLDDILRYNLHAGGVYLCYVGRDINAAEALVKEALEETFEISYDELPKRKLPQTKAGKVKEKAAILIPKRDKDGNVQRLLEAFCRKYKIDPVPIYNFNDCFNVNTPKIIIAYSFSDKQLELLPTGFNPIPLKDLGGKFKELISFDEVKEIAKEWFLKRC